MNDLPRFDIVNFNFFDWDGDRVLTGGAERYVTELARVIRSLGAQPRILQNANRRFAKIHDDVPVLGVPAAATMDMTAISAGFSEFVRDAALVIASPLELAVRLSTPAPVIGINHGIHWDYPNNRLDLHDPALERRIIDAMMACHACVSVDTNFYNWVRCLDAEASSRVRFIPNFVDLGLFNATTKRFDGPRLELLFPRRLCVERGFHEIVTAFDYLMPRHPLLNLHLCGSGADEDEQIAREFLARHPQQVRWSMLEMDEMRTAYATSHVVLIPTMFAEGTSLSCIEAMATNNAVVTTAVGGLPNLVIDGYNGIIAPPGATGIIDAVERLAHDRAMIERLARNALSVAPAFARERWAARWTTLLREALPSPHFEHERTAQVKNGGADPDPYLPIAWPFGLEAERERLLAERDAARVDAATSAREARDARAAQASAAQQLYWRDSELSGIKNSTGWAVLQQMYRVRFAVFPRGSWREAAAKWLLHRGRALRRRMMRKSASVLPTAALSGPPSLPKAVVPPHGTGLATRYAIVCLPILEWSFRFQRPQQLARRFAITGHEVLFAKHNFGPRLASRLIEPGIEEIELPGTAGTNPYRDRLSNEDAQRMADALLAHLASRGSGRFVCVVQLPFWAGVARYLREASGCDIAYDCMDLHSGFSSNSKEALVDEERLLAEADLVICASRALVEHAAPHARRTTLVQNGVDYGHFAAVPAHVPNVHEALTIGYYGAIADWFDSDLVAGIARLRPNWQIVLIGSTWSADMAPLESMPNISLTGEKPYAELPTLIAGWDCCVIPFRHTPLTAATNPVKIYEMLAAAKPVVSVALPELATMGEAGLVALADGSEAFVAAIETEVAADSDERRRKRRDYAKENTWEVRGQSIVAAIDALLPLVSIIVVTFNNRELNELCLASIFHDTDYPDFEVIVVDNASKDGTQEMLQQHAERDARLRVLLNADNKGFAAANNQGAALARGRYLCFLNNDTVVHGAWLRTLIGHLRRHAHLGLVGPVTNAIGNEARIPVGYSDISGMPAWADGHCAMHRGRLADVSMLAFFCVAMPRWVWRIVGPLDERFGAGMFEDDDYNRRVRAAGFEVGLAWDSFVHHWQLASFKLLGDDEYLRIYRTNEALYASKWSESPAANNSLSALKAQAVSARGTVIFAPSVGWAIHLAQRPHHLARVLAEDGYVVVFDVSNASDEVDTLREAGPRLFLYKGPPSALAGLPRTVLWTFSYNYDYRDNFPSDTPVVYDWIDDLTVFPYEKHKLEALHARALRQADVVISVARRLHERAIQSRPDARYVPNAVEEGRFDHEPQPNLALTDSEFARALDAGRPIAGYYGALAKWFDFALVARTAQLRPDWSFVLIGPDHDGSLARSKLDRLPNLYCLGPRPYLSLPGYLHRFDVATIPFVINDITLATSPLKLFEYFAAGRPVISTSMPECAAFPEVSIVKSAEEFSAALDSTRDEVQDPAFRARLAEHAARNTWRARARATMDAVAAARRTDRRPPESPSPKSGAVPTELPPRDDEAVPSPAALSIMKRFANLETSDNRHYFRALAAHLAGSHDDPCLPMYFEFALSANDRGRKVAALINSFVPLSGKRALDVGCAYGGFVVALGERGADPIGFDIDDSLLALAEHNFRDVGRRYHVRNADVTKPEDIATFLESFDVITCNDVIEHVSDPAVTLRHIASMLRSGGLAYFEIPNRDNVEAVVADGHYQLFGITQLDREAAGRYYSAHAPGLRYGVEHYLRLDSYRALFSDAGLSVELVGGVAPSSIEAVRASLAALRENLPAHIKDVPQELRDEVRQEIVRYLDAADHAPDATAKERSDFLDRYGTGFWRIVARKMPQVEKPVPARDVATLPGGMTARDPPAPLALAHKRFLRGMCNVCGKPTRFFRDDPSLDRESLSCEHCRTTSRYRSIARGVLTAIAARTGLRTDAIAHLPIDAEGASYAVYDTQPSFRFEPCAYPIPDLLRRCRWIDITVSSYRSEIAPGAPLAEHVVNQNLESLTFQDASFDLVVTSDVMEHVRLDGRAHAEIARVLKPGGIYVFTVPHFRDRRETFVRVCVHDPDDPSRDEYLTEPEYHGDANAPDGRGALSFRSYGTVLDEELAALGFDVSYSFVDDDVHGIRNTELFYCVKRTRAA